MLLAGLGIVPVLGGLDPEVGFRHQHHDFGAALNSENGLAGEMREFRREEGVVVGVQFIKCADLL